MKRFMLFLKVLLTIMGFAPVIANLFLGIKIDWFMQVIVFACVINLWFHES